MDNMAEMLIDYIRRIHSNCIEAEHLAQAISVRCKRRIGEQIVELKEDGKLDGGRPKTIVVVDGFNSSTRVKLADIGITPDQSSNYQAIAAIPEPVFEEIAGAIVKGTAAPIYAAEVRSSSCTSPNIYICGDSIRRRLGCGNSPFS